MDVGPIINSLVNTPDGRLFLILLILALPRFIDTVTTLIRNRGMVDKQAGELEASEAEAAAQERKRQDEQTDKWQALVSSLVVRQDRLTSAIEASTAEDKIAHAIESSRIKFRESETAAWRASIQEQTIAVAGFSPALAAGVAHLATDIEKAHAESVRAIGERVDEMGAELTGKLDERLSETTKSLNAMQSSFEELVQTIKTTLAPIPEQFSGVNAALEKVNEQLKVVNQQITDLRHELAVNKNDGLDSVQTDADHAANVKTDASAFAGPVEIDASLIKGTITLDKAPLTINVQTDAAIDKEKKA